MLCITTTEDGTFTDVTDKAGVGDVGWGMGVAQLGITITTDSDDHLRDLSLVQITFFENTGKGTFVDVTQSAGVQRSAVVHRRCFC